ncbi:hypothetical protein AVANS14531_06030 [Campylobacter sp. Cr9]|uniref:hypothetical protein n=1 Tax=unclassified Campylobacter TaxID=2593542 RepID=UPI001EFB340C|nr:hypothetical protein [Campylobacter sp. RM5004]MBZ7985890.1 hypothetical protein [Campylobacter sp. Cr9]ULO01779.1 putative membrane protein [Campylobacter sp. RM5004]
MLGLDSLILPYIHLLAGICFIGLHIGIRANASFYLCENEEDLQKTLKNLKKQIYAFFILMAIMAFSAVFVMINNSNDPLFSTLASTQWSLYAFATLNLLYIYYQFILCEKEKENKLLVCSEKIALIVYYFIPLNILISCIGVLFALLISTMI